MTDPYLANNLAKGRLSSNLELAAQLHLERRLNPSREGRMSRLSPLLKKLMAFLFVRVAPVRR
jgi:hypothetical protein